MTWDAIIGIISTPTTMAVLTGVIEFAMRLWPTSKAWSLLVPVKAAAVGLAAVLTFVAGLTQVLIDSGNNVKPAVNEKT